jgi:hypothetical protein
MDAKPKNTPTEILEQQLAAKKSLAQEAGSFADCGEG